VLLKLAKYETGRYLDSTTFSHDIPSVKGRGRIIDSRANIYDIVNYFVFNVFLLHHLPMELKIVVFKEMYRVLKK